MMSEYNSPEMADDPHSSSSSDSDSYDSSIASMSELLKPETFPLCSMDSSSDSEGCQPLSLNFHIQIKPKMQERYGISRLEQWKTSHLDAYLGDIISNQGKVKFFPERMEKFLSTKYKRKYLELSNLQHGTFFIYLARSLIVTLNVDNPRVRVPKSLVFDACIFSEDNPVVVLSVFDTDKISTRMEMYNNFVAQGVTDALRSRYREDITITNSAVTMDHNFMEEVPRLWENPGIFHISSSLDMWRDKAEEAAVALLKSVSVASSYSMLYPRERADGYQILFLTESEFQFLTNFIDLQGDSEEASVEGDALLLQTEICLRLRKRYKTALLMHAGTDEAQEVLTDVGNAYSSLEELEGGDNNYELVITDVQVDKKQLRKIATMVIFVEVSKAETNPKVKEFFKRILRKRNTNRIDIAERTLGDVSGNLRNQTTKKKDQARVESKLESKKSSHKKQVVPCGDEKVFDMAESKSDGEESDVDNGGSQRTSQEERYVTFTRDRVDWVQMEWVRIRNTWARQYKTTLQSNESASPAMALSDHHVHNRPGKKQANDPSGRRDSIGSLESTASSGYGSLRGKKSK